MKELFQQFLASRCRNSILYLLGSILFVLGVLILWARWRGVPDATIAIGLAVFVVTAFVISFLVAVFKRDYRAPQDSNTDLRNTTYFLFGLAAFGCLAIAVWGTSRTNALATIAQGLLLFGGAGLVGGVLGLLFGIPKAVSDPVVAQPSNGAGQAGPSNSARASYTVNTNLEQISDWLTKIIVGVGLIELSQLRTEFAGIAQYFGQVFATTADACTAGCKEPAAAILVYGLAAGFLAGYLLTRISLPGAFNRADQQLREIQKAKNDATAQFGRDMTEISKDLYSYEQEGFRKAIDKLDSLLVSDAAKNNPALWAYLAAAHGQAWKWENAKRKNGAEKTAVLKAHRDAALRAINKATTLSEDWKPILQTMWNKNQKGKEEDDLEVFFNDPDFKKALG